MKKLIAGAVLSLAALFVFSLPAAEAASLSHSQIDAIIRLLMSFSVDQTTINKVQSALKSSGSAAVAAAVPAPITLNNGVPSAPVTSGKNAYTSYAITVPAGATNLTITTQGGSGDDDIYVKLGTQPVTTGNNACSWNTGDYTWKGATPATNESVFIANPTAGTYYITIASCSSMSNIVTTASYTVPLVSLSNGVGSAPLTSAQETYTYYSINVPPGASSLTVNTTGGSGDDDIYVKLGSQPKTSGANACSWNSWDYTWSGATPAVNESTTIQAPTPGVYYITIASCSSISNIVTTATYTLPSLTLSASSLNFGSVAVGATSPVQTITLTNTGSAALSITSLFAFTGDFTGSGNCYTSSPLAPGQSCALNMTFTPTASGTRTGTITMTSNDATGTRVVPLTGVGVMPVPAVSISPSALTFASTNVGATSQAQTITFTNTGTASLSFTNLFAFTGDFAGSGNCYTTTPLAPGQNCQLNVTFTPTTSGTRTGSITVATNDPTGTKTIALTGAGVLPVPTLSLSASSLNFGSTNVGATSQAQVITITNTGTASLTFTNLFSFTGDFTGWGNCYTTTPLAPGQSCQLNVTFAPTTSGTRTGTVTMASNDPSGTKTVTLTGSGVISAPALTVSSASLTFGSVSLGATSPSQTLTITNTGTASLTFTNNFAFTGDFTGSGTCYTSVPLSPGQNCQLNVTFTPTASGTRTGTITMASNDPGSPDIVNLTGTGVTLAAGVTNLTSGVASAPLTTASGAYTYYAITVPTGASNLTITTTGGSGDDDIYVKLGSQPKTTGANACSWNTGDYTWKGATAATNESVSIANPAAGTYYITIASCSSISNIVTKATYTSPVVVTPTVITLANGVPSTPVTSVQGANTYYSITVPTGASSLAITTTGGSGDDDFYVSLGSMPQPVPGGYTWKGATYATNESLTIANPVAGIYNIVLNAYTAISNIVTTASYSTTITPPTTLSPKLTLSASSLTFGSTSVGATSPAQTITLTNTGSASLTFTNNFAFTGDFAGTGTCSTAVPLLPGTSCLLNVTFSPTASGTRTGTITMATNDPAGAKTVTLTGTATSVVVVGPSCNTSAYTVTPAVNSQAAWDTKFNNGFGAGAIPDTSGGAEAYAWQGYYWVRAFVTMAKVYGDTKYLDQAVGEINYWLGHQDGGPNNQGWGYSFVLANPSSGYSQMQLDTGMIANAIAFFAYEVWNDSRFTAYRTTADNYLNQIEPILHTYDFQWVDGAPYAGSPSFYRYNTCGGGLCSAASLLAYNQGATMSRALLYIDRTRRLEGKTPDSGYLYKANKAAAYFKTFVSNNGNAYIWNYSGAVPQSSNDTEDVDHGHVDLALVNSAYQFGLGGITSTDMSHLASTYGLILSSAGANDASTFIDGSGTAGTNNWDRVAPGFDWIDLVDFNPSLLNSVTNVYNAKLQGEKGSRFMLGWAEILRKRACITL